MKPNKLIKIQGLKGLRDLIKGVCENHPAISLFKSGLNILDDKTEDNVYPLAFLESDFISEIDSDVETYFININIADTLNPEGGEEDYINAISKTEQIMSEIHHTLKNYSKSFTVSSCKKLSYRDYDTDNLVVTRGEFSIVLANYTARFNNPTKFPINATFSDDFVIPDDFVLTD